MQQNQIPDDIEQLIRNLANKLAKQASEAEDWASQIKDPSSKKKLLEAVVDMKRLVPQITDTFKKAFAASPSERDFAPVHFESFF